MPRHSAKERPQFEPQTLENRVTLGVPHNQWTPYRDEQESPELVEQSSPKSGMGVSTLERADTRSGVQNSGYSGRSQLSHHARKSGSGGDPGDGPGDDPDENSSGRGDEGSTDGSGDNGEDSDEGYHRNTRCGVRGP